jgi:archaellum component FlaG (FlaF/FlaG flagellin family)
MKRQALIFVFLAAMIVALPAAAKSKTVIRIEGWIVDSYCKAKNAHAEGAEDTLACHNKGAKLLLISTDGTTYTISIKNQERALENLGRQVMVLGQVDADRNLEISTYMGTDALKPPDKTMVIIPAKEDEASKPSETPEPTKKDD